jgi:hypothetical protein
MGVSTMPPRKSVADILIDYTEALMADQRPEIAKDVAALDSQEQEELRPLLTAVRSLKAAYHEVPDPGAELLQKILARGSDLVSSEEKDTPTRELAPHRERSGYSDQLTADRFFASMWQTIKAISGDRSRWKPLRVTYHPGQRLAFSTRLLDSKGRSSIRVWFELDFGRRDFPLLSTIAFFKHKKNPKWNDELLHGPYERLPVFGGIDKGPQERRPIIGIRLKMPAEELRHLSWQPQDALVVQTLTKFFSTCCEAIERGLHQLT